MCNEILEIKDCIDSVYGADCAYYGVDGIGIATVLYEDGWRKQKQGHWITDHIIQYSKENNKCYRQVVHKCSECGHSSKRSKPENLHYCCNCGAKMLEEQK